MINVQDPAHASFWIYPYQSVKIKPGKLMTYYWTCNVPMFDTVDFTVNALEVQIDQDFELGDVAKFKEITGAPFPMPLSQSKCSIDKQALDKYKNYASPCSF